MIKIFLVVVLAVLIMLQVSFAAQPFASGVCTGCADKCSLIPPAGGKFPCYQGTPADAAKCFQTDPLLASGTTWACGTCSSFGYPNYLQNDPIYHNMELWTAAKK